MFRCWDWEMRPGHFLHLAQYKRVSATNEFRFILHASLGWRNMLITNTHMPAHETSAVRFKERICAAMHHNNLKKIFFSNIRRNPQEGSAVHVLRCTGCFQRLCARKTSSSVPAHLEASVRNQVKQFLMSERLPTPFKT